MAHYVWPKSFIDMIPIDHTEGVDAFRAADDSGLTVQWALADPYISSQGDLLSADANQEDEDGSQAPEEER